MMSFHVSAKSLSLFFSFSRVPIHPNQPGFQSKMQHQEEEHAGEKESSIASNHSSVRIIDPEDPEVSLMVNPNSFMDTTTMNDDTDEVITQTIDILRSDGQKATLKDIREATSKVEMSIQLEEQSLREYRQRERFNYRFESIEDRLRLLSDHVQEVKQESIRTRTTAVKEINNLKLMIQALSEQLSPLISICLSSVQQSVAAKSHITSVSRPNVSSALSVDVSEIRNIDAGPPTPIEEKDILSPREYGDLYTTARDSSGVPDVVTISAQNDENEPRYSRPDPNDGGMGVRSSRVRIDGDRLRPESGSSLLTLVGEGTNRPSDQSRTSLSESFRPTASSTAVHPSHLINNRGSRVLQADVRWPVLRPLSQTQTAPMPMGLTSSPRHVALLAYPSYANAASTMTSQQMLDRNRSSNSMTQQSNIVPRTFHSNHRQ